VATAVEAFASKPVSPAERVLLLGSAVAAVAPFQLLAVAGIALGAAMLARHLVAGRRASVQQNAAG
jgi:predicted alpha/beta-fold hydrolase